VRAVFGFALTLTVAAVVAAFHPGTHPARSPGASASARVGRSAPRRRERRVARAVAARPVAAAARPVAAAREVTVWLPYWDMAAAYASAVDHADVVGTASPFWYSIAGDSTIESDPGAGDGQVIDGLHARGIKVVPTVTETEGMAAFDSTLANPRRRAAMVRTLVRIAAGHAYDGLDLDFEQFAVDRSHAPAPADEAASAYPIFVAQVCAALHAMAKGCVVTVMPRTSSVQIYWRGKLATWVYDYGALAQAADRVQIMAYDEHAPGTSPGPVAPYPWVEQVVDYARSTMPPAKTELALAAYGYDFAPGATTSITTEQAEELAAQTGARPKWNSSPGEESFTYGTRRHRHRVWYENAESEYDRASLAKADGFAGVDLWYAGGEDPALWPLLGGLF
jgi:spore germination protein YaaH